MGQLDGDSHTGFDHVALFHEGPEYLAAVAASQLRKAAARGGAAFVCLDEPVWRRVGELIGDVTTPVSHVPQEALYTRPASALKAVVDFVRSSVRDGASGVWSIGAIPFDGRHDDDWVRYEAAVDAVLGHLPLRAMCAYDTATTPPRLLDAAARTHADLHDAGRGRRRSPLYSRDLGGVRPSIEPPPRAPDLGVEVTGPAPARRAVEHHFGPRLTGYALRRLQLVVSELVTNALVHGAPPVELVAWVPVTDDRIVVEVVDRGPGVDDPYLELRPPGDRGGGAGLWVVGQICDRVATRIHERGSSVLVEYRVAGAAN